MKPIAEDRVYKISLGMLVMMAGGLGAIIIAWTTMEIQTQANTKRLDDNDARWERVEKIAEDVAVIKDKVIRIDGTVTARGQVARVLHRQDRRHRQRGLVVLPASPRARRWTLSSRESRRASTAF